MVMPLSIFITYCNLDIGYPIIITWLSYNYIKIRYATYTILLEPFKRLFRLDAVLETIGSHVNVNTKSLYKLLAIQYTLCYLGNYNIF